RPLREVLDPVLYAIREAVDRSEADLRCIRIDDLKHAGRITPDLTEGISASALCVVDLSGLNPNVMWEAGFAMALQKPIIFLSQDVDHIPFDLKDFRVIGYELERARKALPSELIVAIRDTLEHLPAPEPRGPETGAWWRGARG